MLFLSICCSDCWGGVPNENDTMVFVRMAYRDCMRVIIDVKKTKRAFVVISHTYSVHGNRPCMYCMWSSEPGKIISLVGWSHADEYIQFMKCVYRLFMCMCHLILLVYAMPKSSWGGVLELTRIGAAK